MDKIQKKKLCPNNVSPGLGVHSKVGGWDMDKPTSEWRIKYRPKIFLWASNSLMFLIYHHFFKATIILKKIFCQCPSWIKSQVHFLLTMIWTTFKKSWY
jgi:hypothetical protein